MSEAKRRRAELESWLSSLSEDERTVFDASYAVFNDIIAAEKLLSVCYLMTFFLTEYLRENHGITVEPIVGYVTDERDDLPISHAWVEFQGKVLDLTLFYTSVQPRGPVLILDRAIKGGEIGYKYHREMAEASRASLEEVYRSQPGAREFIDHKKMEHAAACAANASSETRMAFLESAPEDRNFEALSSYLG